MKTQHVMNHALELLREIRRENSGSWRRKVGTAVALAAAASLALSPVALAMETGARETGSTEKAETAPTEAAPQSTKININTATLSELDTLPGIGPALAQKIVDGRPYAKAEDIQKVSGIGPKTYEKLKDLITVE